MSEPFKAIGFIPMPSGHNLDVEYHSDVLLAEMCHCHDVHEYCAHPGSPMHDALSRAFGAEETDTP